MKKVFVTLAIIIAISGAGYAQTFQLGIKGGANISNFTGNSSVQGVKESSLVGFHAGVFSNFQFGSVFSVQPELLISSAGSKLENATDKQNFKATYATLPVMLKLKAGGFYVEGGPQVGLRVSDNLDNVNTDAKNLDFALAAGVGYHSKIGLGIGARYIAGLSKVGDLNFSGGVHPDYKNSTIQVGLFWTLFNNDKN